MLHQIITVLLLTALLIVGYYMAQGCPFRSLLLALAVVALMPVLDPSLQGLHPALYAMAVGLVYVGVQFVMPLVDGRQFVMRWELPHLTIAVAVVRHEGVHYA